MRRLQVDRLTEVLPELDELRPVLDHVLSTSSPDPRRMWSGAGELGTVGGRLVDGSSLDAAADGLADRAREHLREVYRRVAGVAGALEEGDEVAAAELLVEIAELEEAADRPDRAEAYALAAVGLAREVDGERSLALGLRRAARAARARGRLEPALERYREAREIAEAVAAPRAAAEAAIGAGNVLEEQGRWRDAEGWYRLALESLDQVDGPVPERWHAALNVHIVLRSRGEVEASRKWLEDAERAAEAVGDPDAAVFLDNARGQLRMVERDFAGAQETFRRALDQAEGARARVTVRLNLAEALLAQGRSLQAGEEAREAEREALGARVVSRLPEVYRMLGRVAARQENPDAFVLFERAVRLVREQGLPRLEEAVTLQAYAEAERRRGDDVTAGILLQKAREIYDELGIRHPRRRWVDLFGSGAGEGDDGGGADDHA